jgi:hypothetical protein
VTSTAGRPPSLPKASAFAASRWPTTAAGATRLPYPVNRIGSPGVMSMVETPTGIRPFDVARRAGAEAQAAQAAASAKAAMLRNDFIAHL